MGATFQRMKTASDRDERGVVFMALNANIARQFEFVQQQWIQYGNDSRIGNDRDVLMGHHGGHGKFVIQGDTSPMNPPFICSKLPDFVELRGAGLFLSAEHYCIRNAGDGPGRSALVFPRAAGLRRRLALRSICGRRNRVSQLERGFENNVLRRTVIAFNTIQKNACGQSYPTGIPIARRMRARGWSSRRGRGHRKPMMEMSCGQRRPASRMARSIPSAIMSIACQDCGGGGE